MFIWLENCPHQSFPIGLNFLNFSQIKKVPKLAQGCQTHRHQDLETKKKDDGQGHLWRKKKDQLLEVENGVQGHLGREKEDQAPKAKDEGQNQKTDLTRLNEGEAGHDLETGNNDIIHDLKKENKSIDHDPETDNKDIGHDHEIGNNDIGHGLGTKVDDNMSIGRCLY